MGYTRSETLTLPTCMALMQDGGLSCVTQKVIQHFEGVQRRQGLTTCG